MTRCIDGKRRDGSTGRGEGVDKSLSRVNCDGVHLRRPGEGVPCIGVSAPVEGLAAKAEMVPTVWYEPATKTSSTGTAVAGAANPADVGYVCATRVAAPDPAVTAQV